MKPIEPIYRMLGLKVEQMRTTLGWTQAELAKKLGWLRSSLCNLEKGRSRLMLHDIEKLAKIFNTTPKHFLRGIWI